MNKSNLIIYYAIILQSITGVFLLTSEPPIRVASLGVFYDLFAIPQIGALLMLLGVFFAVVGLFINNANKLRFLFFLWQYIFLLLTAGSSINYIYRGMYADGVIRPHDFIFLDQLPYLVIAFVYTIQIFDFRKERHDTTEV